MRLILWDLYYETYTNTYTMRLNYETYTIRLILWDLYYNIDLYYETYYETYTITLILWDLYYETYTMRLML